MAHSPESIVSLAQVFKTLRVYWLRWSVVAVLVWLAAGAYAVLKHDVWEASQGLILRNDAANSLDAPGKFKHEDEMKTTQETVLEVASSSGVLRPALVSVGPPDHYKEPGAWPTLQDIADVRSSLKISAPKGAEFGKTEVFYLKVQDKSHNRAINLVDCIWDQLRRSLSGLREGKAASILEELAKSEALARVDLEKATAQMEAFEVQIPADLAELRMLHQSPSGDSDLKRTLTEVQAELRKARTAEKSTDELHKVLIAAQKDPSALLAAPNALLESQPTLRRLKDGLIDAQLRTATLSGSMREDHPQVTAAKQAEKVIRQNIFEELEVAVRGLKAEAELNNTRSGVVREQMESLDVRLASLAKMRASYSTVANEVEHARKLHEDAVRKHSDARSSVISATSTNLLSRIDRAETGPKPQGPSRQMIAVAGIVGGLLAGWGFVLLTAPLVRPMSSHVELLGLPATSSVTRLPHVDHNLPIKSSQVHESLLT